MANIKADPSRLRFKDWKEIEGLTGKSMGWLINDLRSGMGNMSADDFEAMVWVAVKRDNPSFTREQASELGPSDLVAAADPKESGGASTP